MSVIRLFPLKVHCWGGFGSQLYALTLVIDLKKRFPQRSLIFYFHDGGVTKRSPEILELLNGVDFKLVPDFAVKEDKINTVGYILKLKLLVKRIAIGLLKASGVLASADNDKEFAGLRPWVFSIRGHYSHRTQNHLTLSDVYSRMLLLKDTNFDYPHLTIHYRLGDLTQIETKHPVSSHQIEAQIVRNNPNGLSVVVFSDSVDKAVDLLSNTSYEIKSGYGNSIQTVLQIVHSKFFIGTSSKISYWATIFRLYSDSLGASSLPLSDRKQIEMNLGRTSPTTVNYY